MRRNVLILAALTAGLVPLLAACGSSSKSSNATTTESSGGSGGGGGKRPIAGVSANDHGTKAVAGKGKTEVELDDFYFQPTVLEGKAGEQVTLELKNEGKVEHSFTVDSQNWMSRTAVDFAVAKATGGQVPSSPVVPQKAFEDSLSGKPNPVTCDPSLSGDAFLSSHLTKDQIKAALAE